MLATVSSLVGVAVGIVLQHILNRSREAEKQRALLRDAAYIDYFQAVADVVFAQDDDERRLALRKATAAKVRIAIYGSDKALAELANLERVSRGLVGAYPDDLARLVAGMRGSTVDVEDVKTVLFGAVDVEDVKTVLFGAKAAPKAVEKRSLTPGPTQ